MSKKIVILGFFASVVILISLSFFLISGLHNQDSANLISPVSSGQAYVLAPTDLDIPEFQAQINASDARPLIIQNYLRRFNSPLEPYSGLIVEISDKYHLDYRLLVAIARQESGLCKAIPPDSYNCWGFGIYGDKVTRFADYPQGLEIVARTLKREYVDKGLDTPEKIMVKYTPPSVEIGGPWAKGVSQFFAELE